MIVVFGSINVDIRLEVPTLPRPGETVLGETYALSAGGKGANQALAAARNGADVALFGCVGRDGFADTALAALRIGGVDLSAVRQVALPTALAAIGVDQRGDNQIMVASGANRRADAADVPDAVLDVSKVVLMQLEVPIDQIEALARRARARGARVVLNAAPATALPRAIVETVDFLAVNEIEAEMLARAYGLDASDPIVASAGLARSLGRPVIVTLGARGARAFGDFPPIAVGVLPIVARDTTGAGDAFIGAFAAALDRGRDVEDAMRYGSVAGGLACLAEGAQQALPGLQEIQARLAELGDPL